MPKLDLLLALIEVGILDSDLKLKDCSNRIKPQMVEITYNKEMLAFAVLEHPDLPKRFPEIREILLEGLPLRKRQATQPINDLQLV